MSDTPFGIPLRDELAATREELGLSQAELAAEVGVSSSAVAHWETYHSKPNLENAEKLRETLQRLQASDDE